MFRAHPERGARFLSKIPRLEVVAEVIRRQQDIEGEPCAIEEARQGAKMLHLALELDRRIYRGVPFRSALAELTSLGLFEAHMLNTLKNDSPARADFEVRRLPVQDLRAGMVLDSDILSKDENVPILEEGTILTGTWIERLENFGARGTRKLIDVRIPRMANLRKSEEFGEGIFGTGGYDK